MSRLYTSHLFNLSAAAGGSDFHGPVPDGHRLVVTDMRMRINGNQFQGLDNDINVQLSGMSANYWIWWIGAGCSYYADQPHWTGRQVIDQGNYITLVNQSRLSVQIRVTGFDLLLP